MKHKLIILSLLLAPFSMAHAEGELKYSTETVRRAVELIIPQTVNDLGIGKNTLTVRNHSIVVVISNKGVVERIGMPLFSDAQRSAMPLPVYDYLEYALMDKTLHVSDNKLLYNDIKFRTGGWDTLLSITEADECNVSTVDDKANIIEWVRGGKTVVEMLVPINYASFANAPRAEMELNLIRDLEVFYPQEAQPLQVEEENLSKVKDGDYTIYMQKGRSYLNAAITDNTYYGIGKDDSVVPIVDKRLAVQSIANIVMLNNTKVPDADVDVTFILTEGKKEHRQVTVRQLVDYMRQTGCSPYYGYEKTEGNIIYGALFFYNQASGYDHVMSFNIDATTIGRSQRMRFTSNAYLYIPTTNVKNAYNKIFQK